MRHLSIVTVLGILVVAPAAHAAPMKAREAWASGSLEHFDSTAKSVVIKQGSHEMTFVLASDAHLLQGKKALQPNDLASDVGHHVKVRYTANGATKFADRIEVAETAPAHASKTPANK